MDGRFGLFSDKRAYHSCLNRMWDFNQLEIWSGSSWIWQLHENQSYLGRCVLRLRRVSEGSLTDLLTGEWLDLHHDMKLLEKYLQRRFSPDRMNYAQLGNEYPRLHIHAVPRYASPRNHRGVQFVDRNWGQNWSPTPESPIDVLHTYAVASELRLEIRHFMEQAT